jgi:hypothetical protein
MDELKIDKGIPMLRRTPGVASGNRQYRRDGRWEGGSVNNPRIMPQFWHDQATPPVVRFLCRVAANALALVTILACVKATSESFKDVC